MATKGTGSYGGEEEDEAVVTVGDRPGEFEVVLLRRDWMKDK